MKFIYNFLCVFTLASCGLDSGGQGRICVKVVDQNGVPISGATVLPQVPFFQVRSNKNGKLCFGVGRIIHKEGYQSYLLPLYGEKGFQSLDKSTIVLTPE